MALQFLITQLNIEHQTPQGVSEVSALVTR